MPLQVIQSSGHVCEANLSIPLRWIIAYKTPEPDQDKDSLPIYALMYVFEETNIVLIVGEFHLPCTDCTFVMCAFGGAE